MRRVVVTGLGLLTPLGWGVEHNWKGIVEGRSGIGRAGPCRRRRGADVTIRE